MAALDGFIQDAPPAGAKLLDDTCRALAEVLDPAGVLVIAVDVEGRVVSWSNAAVTMTGFDETEVLGKSFRDDLVAQTFWPQAAVALGQCLADDTSPSIDGLMIDDDDDASKCFRQESGRGRDKASHELALVCKDGNYAEFLVNFSSQRGDEGNIIGAIGICQHTSVNRRRQSLQPSAHGSKKQITTPGGKDAPETTTPPLSSQSATELKTKDMAMLIRCAHAPIIGVNVGGCIIEWNDAVAQISGYIKEEVLGQPLDKYLSETSQSNVKSKLERAKRGEQEDLGEFGMCITTKSGDQEWLTMSGAIYRDASGQVAGIVACGQDMASVKKTMTEMSLVVEDLTRLIDTANAPIFGIDVDGMVTEWNRKAAAISGWGKQETLGKPLVETFIHMNYRAEVGRVLQRALEGTETANYEFPLFTKDGQRREILLNATTRRGANGEVTGVIGVGQDITEMRQVIGEKEQVADDLSRLIESANAFIFGVSKDGKITEWNKKAEELSGWTKKETLGHILLQSFVSEDSKTQVQQALAQAWKGVQTPNVEFAIVTKDGGMMEISLNATPRLDAGGNVTGMVGVGQDITTLRQAVVRSELVADDLVRLIDTANAPIFGIDCTGCVTEWNRKAAEITGWSHDESLGKKLVETFIHEEYRADVSKVLTFALEGHETANFEFPLFTKSGERREILLNATSRLGPTGDIVGVIGVGQDITELRALVRQSQLEADDMSRLVETANAPIFGVDVNGCVTEWNCKAAIITGWSKKDTHKRLFVKEYIHSEHQVRVQEVLDRALAGEDVGNFGLPLYSKDGQKRDILLNATPRWGVDGKVVGVVGVGQDITELNKQRSEAIRTASQLQQIIDTASAPIIGLDTEGLVTEWNDHVAECTGLAKQEIMGKEFLPYVLEGCRSETQRVFNDAFMGTSTPKLEVLVSSSQKKDPVVFLLSVAPRMGPGDSITGVICIGQDITHLREMEMKKSQLMATVTHELRSPLHGIIGLSDNLLAMEDVPQDSVKPLTMINNCARRLLDIVTNIIDISTLVQSKKSKLTKDAVEIYTVVTEVLTLTANAVDKAGRPIKKPEVELISTVDESSIPTIEADAHRCTQMLYNLVSNALKFTEKGTVTVSAVADDMNEVVVIKVADTGTGISPESREVIFRCFEQEDQSERRRFEGLGLGLSISREIAVKHGGSLTVESEQGKGSTFIVTLPYRAPSLNRRGKKLGMKVASTGDLPVIKTERCDLQSVVEEAEGESDSHHSSTSEESVFDEAPADGGAGKPMSPRSASPASVLSSSSRKTPPGSRTSSAGPATVNTLDSIGSDRRPSSEGPQVASRLLADQKPLSLRGYRRWSQGPRRSSRPPRRHGPESQTLPDLPPLYTNAKSQVTWLQKPSRKPSPIGPLPDRKKKVEELKPQKNSEEPLRPLSPALALQSMQESSQEWPTLQATPRSACEAQTQDLPVFSGTAAQVFSMSPTPTQDVLERMEVMTSWSAPNASPTWSQDLPEHQVRTEQSLPSARSFDNEPPGMSVEVPFGRVESQRLSQSSLPNIASEPRLTPPTMCTPAAIATMDTLTSDNMFLDSRPWVFAQSEELARLEQACMELAQLCSSLQAQNTFLSNKLAQREKDALEAEAQLCFAHNMRAAAEAETRESNYRARRLENDLSFLSCSVVVGAISQSAAFDEDWDDYD